jgi:Flp pilus assembly protein TadD
MWPECVPKRVMAAGARSTGRGSMVHTEAVMVAGPGGPYRSLTEDEGRGSRRGSGSLVRWIGVALVCLVVAAPGCTSSRLMVSSVRITPDELLSGGALGEAAKTPGPVVAEQDVLAVSAEMREFLNRHVERKAGDELKLHQLVSAIMDSRTFGVTYDTTTRTASETFRTRKGNCLSFSSMFVAMARDVGLRAQFQEVDIPPDWTLDKDTYVLNQHVDVRVDLRPTGVRAVDFNIADFRASYEMHTIPDARALAHYYNNVGVERMQAGDTASALECFRRAILVTDRKFSPAWGNLGTLYLRTGHPGHAEAAYLQALSADRGDLVAMSDLARLYERLGDPERAGEYRKKVIHHRWLNPYYRYELAREAYLSHHYDTAIGHLKYAVRKRPREDQFCYLLGLSYLKDGNARAAERWLARAKEVAAGDPLKRQYARKMDRLLGGEEKPH